MGQMDRGSLWAVVGGAKAEDRTDHRVSQRTNGL